jgi:hypothetical protein
MPKLNKAQDRERINSNAATAGKGLRKSAHLQGAWINNAKPPRKDHRKPRVDWSALETPPKPL